MMKELRILLIEDEMVYKTVMSNSLYQYGIKKVKIAENYQKAIKFLAEHRFDVVLIDVFISGDKTGIALGQHINEMYNIPFIYVTSNLNQDLLDIMKDTHPAAVVSKPIEVESFIANIKLAAYNSNENEDRLKNPGDRIFVKRDGIFDKIFLKDIAYVESDHVYLNLYTKERKRVMIRGRLKDFYEKFPDSFLQISRSCIININYIDHFDKQSITVNNIVLEIGRKYKHLVSSKLVTF